ncbi:hypothetical protein MALU111345_14525 [Marinicrinis lubricantis]
MLDSGNRHPAHSVTNQEKIVAVLAYLLFFLPLMMQRTSAYALFHANQGLIFLLMVLSVNVIGTFIPVLGWLFVLPFGNLLLLVYLCFGWYHAVKGETRPLPGIGHYQLLKY